MKSSIKNHPALTYFILTFVISWGGVLILGAPFGFPATKEQFSEYYPIVFLPYLLGPAISSVFLIGLLDGKAGYREFFTRLIRWRLNIRWYAIAILPAPILSFSVLLMFSIKSNTFLPAIVTSNDKITLLVTGISIGLIGGGLMEEPGWTGFAIPRLRRRYSVFITSLIVGLVWGIWHFLPTYWGSGDSSGTLSLSLLIPPCFFYIAVLPAYRALMTWIYDHTDSLFITMLTHASLTASTLFIFAPPVEGLSLILYYLVLAILLWLVVFVLFRLKSIQN